MRFINREFEEDDFDDRPAPSVAKDGLLEPIDDVSETSEKIKLADFDVQYPPKLKQISLPRINYKTSNADL